MTITRPVRATAQSQKLFERAQKHLAGGVGSGTRSPRAGWGSSPIYVAEASGSHVTDVDGTTYIDYQMGQGPLILGHRPPELLAAVTRAINERGSHLALCHELEAAGRRRRGGARARRSTCSASATPAPSACSTRCASRAPRPAAA